MNITPFEARKKLVHLCKTAWFKGFKVDANDVADLHEFIEQVEKQQKKQVPALFKPIEKGS